MHYYYSAFGIVFCLAVSGECESFYLFICAVIMLLVCITSYMF